MGSGVRIATVSVGPSKVVTLKGSKVVDQVGTGGIGRWVAVRAEPMSWDCDSCFLCLSSHWPFQSKRPSHKS